MLDPEVRIIPDHISEPLWTLFEGPALLSDDITQVINLIKKSKLTPEQFTALRKYYSPLKKSKDHPFREKNIFHWAAYYGHLNLKLFKSTSSPLTPEQTLSILLECDKEGKCLFKYETVIFTGECILDIAEHFKVDRKPLKKLFQNSNQGIEPLILTYFIESEVKSFADTASFYGVTAKEFLTLAKETPENGPSEQPKTYAIDYINEGYLASQFIDGFNQLKATPEENIDLISTFAQLYENGKFSEISEKFREFLSSLGEYASKVSYYPNERFKGEIKLVDRLISDTLKPGDVEDFNYSFKKPLEAIEQFRSQRLDEKSRVRIIQRPDTSVDRSIRLLPPHEPLTKVVV
jgi:hypothetical protein